MAMALARKLTILADAAKYDASCASSGAPKRDSRAGAGMGAIGSTSRSGICHSYAPDGRCISLLKLLLTNACTYDCLYCVNRRSSNVRRARFTPEEVVDLTMAFYRRNYIEGLFLSSGILGSPDRTMELMAEVARRLRQDHGFGGYIHLKAVPDASEAALVAAGRHADRISVNIELPAEASLAALAPEKTLSAIRGTMAKLRQNIEGAKAEPRAGRFAPAGQSTQMIVGADDATDRTILAASDRLYSAFKLRRVYYSAFSPFEGAGAALPAKPAPLMREHRLYQADWLTRLYGFEVDEIFASVTDGMLDLDIDPKLAWALGHRERFPVDVNRASRETLMRVPGIGARTAARILSSRRHSSVRLDDLRRLGVRLKMVTPFVVTADHRPRPQILESGRLRAKLAPKARQLSLFGGDA
jgi:putative DNA modification/repair radical SAM protein